MATITLEYDDSNVDAQKTLDYILSMGFFSMLPKTSEKKLSSFEKSLEDIKHGRVTRVKNIDNVIEEILQ
ncbi:hypothetical protein FACS189414_3060 [Bacteroidia bacterium]|nr:hypothetical protein AGMMS49574_08140 [Bacteroidia bacterium]GHU76737.1 hypothetical protein FACS189414_3060 [Bacteroidia bacterium]